MMTNIFTLLLLPFYCYSTPITSLPSSTLGSSTSTSLTVESTLHWNAARNSIYKKGMKLHFEADPQAIWYDVNQKIKTTADGYPNIPGVVLRYNVSNDNIMSMICCMNNQMNNCANVGSSGDLLVTEDGYVSCFANDNSKTYGNNYGAITTEITIKV